MAGSIEIPFAVGERVWWIGSEARKEIITCPECMGQKFIKLIQGNGVEVNIDCACCTVGYDAPTGVIRTTLHEHVPTMVTLGDVEVRGSEFRYSYGNYSLDATALFSTKEECAARCTKLNAENASDREKQAVHHLSSKRRDMAWSVRYWQEQVRRFKDDLKRCEDRLDACKAMACAKAFKPLADSADKLKA